MRQRTHTCGELRATDIQKTVTLQGWVHRTRDLGGLVFIDLRDRYGKTQVVVHPQEQPQLAELAHRLHNEWVVEFVGKVHARPQGMINAEMPTGEVEVQATDLVVLNECPPLPFQLDEAHKSAEELRLKYRYIDLRRPELQNILMLRHRMANLAREHFTEENFIEVETPYLVKSTPEGARDYLVPSRVWPNKFYALPQSPQIYKQILMVAGFDRYFQIVKCFRDEDLRFDRQPEFTQIDVELTFPSFDAIFGVVERFFAKVMHAAWNLEIRQPFPRLSYEHAMETYGSDKPDLRYDLKFVDLSGQFNGCEFKIIASALDQGHAVKGMVLADKAGLSRKESGELEELAKSTGLAGIIPLKYTTEGFAGVLSGKVPDAMLDSVVKAVHAKPGDLVLVGVGKRSTLLPALGNFRRKLAEKFQLFDPNDRTKASLFWVTDFPLFEKDEESGEIYPTHHPFTSFYEEDEPLLASEPWKVRSTAYDLVMNGTELISGSIRIHDPKQQARIFEFLGISQAEAELRFGFLVDALRFGAPPMGGFAIGFDRLIMNLTGGSIRDVIAFPKTNMAQSLMDGCPSDVDPKLIKDLYLDMVDPQVS